MLENIVLEVRPGTSGLFCGRAMAHLSQVNKSGRHKIRSNSDGHY